MVRQIFRFMQNIKMMPVDLDDLEVIGDFTDVVVGQFRNMGI